MVMSQRQETRVAGVPDTAGVTQVLANAHGRLPPVADNKPLFQAMFSDRGGHAVAPAIANLWTTGAVPAGAGGDGASRQNPNGDTGTRDNAARDNANQASPNILASASKPDGLLDLFTDSAADVRGLFVGRG
jgi:hypothetical protein